MIHSIISAQIIVNHDTSSAIYPQRQALSTKKETGRHSGPLIFLDLLGYLSFIIKILFQQISAWTERQISLASKQAKSTIALPIVNNNRLLNTDVNHVAHMIAIIRTSYVRRYFSKKIEVTNLSIIS